MPQATVASQLGAILGGAFFAMALSGFLMLQTFLYFQKFTKDPLQQKLVVAFLWFTDAIQSILVAAATYQFLIVHFGDQDIGNRLFITQSLAIWFTVAMIFGANIFYSYRIYKLSQGNWWVVGPIVFLIFARLGTATTTTVEMCITQSLPEYTTRYKPLWTTGLAINALTDVLITLVLCWHLRSHGQVMSNTQRMLRIIVVLTINNGALTRCATCFRVRQVLTHLSVSSIVSVLVLAFWLAMPHTLVFFALYIVLGKLYATSLIAALSMRNWIRGRSMSGTPRNIMITANGLHVVERSFSVGQMGSTSMTHVPRPELSVYAGDSASTKELEVAHPGTEGRGSTSGGLSDPEVAGTPAMPEETNDDDGRWDDLRML
ncbi:hypothetical protein FA95DRAFT_1609195 [Auriscalpium vulgare]|uniref:Uncharacterized protein n=1 Tax=Auriscalpium vulgare TaxID=40419 RepID=A0ACB8RI93_9AGAM|nr:hypothetical protein FA95DRAFT_1609195 [Auriscalpium vulgare]